MNYRGFTIQEETDTNAMRLGSRYKFFKGTSYDGQVINMASTLDEAAAEIDELTANDPKAEDISGDLLRSLKEMVAEFTEKEYELICDHSVGLCACDPIRILDRAKNAIKMGSRIRGEPGCHNRQA